MADEGAGPDIERWRREVRRASTRLVVLAVLAEGESYAYEILDTLRRRAPEATSATEASVYPLLHDLEHSAFIRGQWRDTPGGGPARKYYRLTREGRGLYDALRLAWIAHQVEMAPFLGGK